MKVFMLRSTSYVAAAAALSVFAGCSSANVVNPSGPVSRSQGAAHSSATILRGSFAIAMTFPRHPISLHPTALSLSFGNGATPFTGQSLYAAQFTQTVVNHYALPNTLNNPPSCTLPGTQVNGLGVNRNHKLYVPNADGNIRTYAPNCGAAGPILKDTTGQPADVAFDGKTVYIANASNGHVDIFANGSHTMTGTLSNAAALSPSFGVAVDHFHNVYESAVGSNPGVVVEYAGGTGGGTVLPITGVSFPIGLQFDKQNNLIVIDANTGGALVYAPPYSGAPSATIAFADGAGFWAKLDKANTRLYVGDPSSPGAVSVYKYPSGADVYTFNNGFAGAVNGVAVDPASL